MENGLTPDYWRQLDMFDPQTFTTPVHIIGVGATGSWVAFILAKMGVKNIIVWDFDIVEVHNLPNQIYGLQEVGLLKVEALKKIILRDCGIEIEAKVEKVDGSQKLEGIVYICTDTMSSRKEIWLNSLKYQLDVNLVIETRLGAELGTIYCVRPLDPTDVREYENTLYDDNEAEESPCSYRAIPTVVSIIAGLASHKLVKFAANSDLQPVIRLHENESHSSYEMLCIRPIVATAHGWK
jgi:molybdopterin/thiamine biosynthesis adenylyltransferase